MAERNLALELELEDLRRQLQKEVDRLPGIDQKIAEGIDFEEEEKLERRKQGIYRKIDELSEQMRGIERAMQHRVIRAREEDLLECLQGNENWQELIQRAYEETIIRWSHRRFPKQLASLPAMVAQLELMGQSEAGYSAMESFVAHLLNDGEVDTELRIGLSQWGQEYYRERNWADLYAKIQDELSKRTKDFKPAILIGVEVAEQTTTHRHNEVYCQLRAWLIEDIATYQQHRTGYHSLIIPGTSEAIPFPLSELDARIQPLLGQFLVEKRQRLGINSKDPEFYIFLPKALLHLAVDYWPLDASDSLMRLGQLYSVTVCCSERFNGPYPTDEWHDFWNKHESGLNRNAREVFVGCGHAEVENFLERVADHDAPECVVGWEVNTAPSTSVAEELGEELKDLFEELLFIGVPLAIWGRCNEGDIDNAGELDALLQRSKLGELSAAIKQKRSQTRYQARKPEYCLQRYIGHHLSLLRDNPNLPLPTAL